MHLEKCAILTNACSSHRRLKCRAQKDAKLSAAPLSHSNTSWWPSNRKARQVNAKPNKSDCGLKMSFCVEIRCLVQLRWREKKKLQGTFARSATKRLFSLRASCPNKICKVLPKQKVFILERMSCFQDNVMTDGRFLPWSTDHTTAESIWKSPCWPRPGDLYGQCLC